MRESGYYPAGAEFDPSSPWNQSDPKDMDFEVTCSQSVSKTVTLTTSNYIPGASGVDYEADGEGGYDKVPWYDEPDTSDTNWAEEYHNNDYHTPLQLIKLLGEVLQKDLMQGIVFRTPKFTEDLIHECEGWCEDETEFIKN